MQRPPQPCMPHTECWCEQHPNNPNCSPYLPIDNGIIVLIVLAILLGLKKVLSKQIKE